MASGVANQNAELMNKDQSLRVSQARTTRSKVPSTLMQCLFSAVLEYSPRIKLFGRSSLDLCLSLLVFYIFESDSTSVVLGRLPVLCKVTGTRYSGVEQLHWQLPKLQLLAGRGRGRVRNCDGLHFIVRPLKNCHVHFSSTLTPASFTSCTCKQPWKAGNTNSR